MTQSYISADASGQSDQGGSGAVRLVTLRLSAEQKARAQESKSFSRYLTNFLDKEIKTPFRYRMVSPSAFAINGTCNTDAFDDYVMNLHDRLLTFLFGSKDIVSESVLVFAGTPAEVAHFISGSEENAKALSRDYLEKVQKQREENAVAATSAGRSEQAASSRPVLLYRGILVCPNEVLLAYIVTPRKHASASTDQTYYQDTALNQFLTPQDSHAIDYTIRVFEEISLFLQRQGKDFKNYVLAVPLSYKSLLSSHARQRFFTVMREHPEWVRDQMILSVICAPPRPSSSMIQRFSGEFSRHFRTTDWQVTLPGFDLSLYQGCNLQSLTFDMHGCLQNRNSMLEQFFLQVRPLKLNRIRPAVSGLETAAELRACCDAGVIYASGNAVTAALPTFTPARKINMNALPVLEPANGSEAGEEPAQQSL